jgi:signal transduction histidine kinase
MPVVQVVALLALFAVAFPAPGQQTSSTVLLTNIAQVVALDTNALAAAPHEARVRGVVIYISVVAQRLYIQDGDRGIQVIMAESATNYHVGQLLEVSGAVTAGRPYPNLIRARAKALGEAALPDAPFVSPHLLADGEEPFRRITTRGIVRDMVSGSGVLTLLLSYEGATFEVAIVDSSLTLPREWLDAEIEVQGKSFPFFNSRGRPTGFRLHTHTTNSIRVIKAGPGTLFDRPSLSIAEVSRQPQQWNERVKIVGTVTAHQPFNIVFVDDGTGPLEVILIPPLAMPPGGKALEHDARVWLQPGERVEVIGVRHNWYALVPTLIHAEIRRIGTAPTVASRRVTIDDLVAGKHAGKLVSVEARLLDQRSWVTGILLHQTVMLKAGDHVFKATWENETPMDWDLTPNSYVRVTGVNDAIQGRFKGARMFDLLLRTPNDIAPAPEPSFWTRKEFQRIALAGGAVAILAGAWILLQRVQMRRLERRVADRTVDLRTANEQLKEEVAARERAEIEVQRALAQEKQLSELKSRFVSMVSHEFRTPLGIISSSAEILDAYLERLSADERKSNIRDITDATRHMARMMEEVLLLGRVEAGKMTCRPGPLDLAAFGQRLVDEIMSATNRRCPIAFTVMPGLVEARADENLLRHIFTNLLNNASKYSRAGDAVEFRVEGRGHLAIFTVRDQGIGIPEADAKLLFQAFHRGRNVGDTPGTGLGMTIVKRCVELHGGKIAFESKEGSGTTFSIALPLFGAADANGESGTQLFMAAAKGKNLTLIS